MKMGDAAKSRVCHASGCARPSPPCRRRLTPSDCRRTLGRSEGSVFGHHQLHEACKGPGEGAAQAHVRGVASSGHTRGHKRGPLPTVTKRCLSTPRCWSLTGVGVVQIHVALSADVPGDGEVRREGWAAAARVHWWPAGGAASSTPFEQHCRQRHSLAGATDDSQVLVIKDGDGGSSQHELIATCGTGREGVATYEGGEGVPVPADRALPPPSQPLGSPGAAPGRVWWRRVLGRSQGGAREGARPGRPACSPAMEMVSSRAAPSSITPW